MPKPTQQQKIVPCLWFNDEGEEAAKFYASIFKNSSVGEISYYNTETPSDKPIGSVLTVSFQIENQTFTALNGGSFFKPNPSISFMLNFDPSRDNHAREYLDEVWEKLADGGSVLMELGKYPFSEHYGWVQDKYGISWQLILTNPDGEERPFVIPSLLYVGSVAGKADEAIDLYTSTFKHSKRGQTARYPEGMAPDKPGTIMFADFTLEGQWLAAMDSAHEHKFKFSEGISLEVRCDSQEEADEYWSKLTAVPESEQCGWLKDKYGVSWQIVPRELYDLLGDPDKTKAKKAMEAMLEQKKIDIKAIKQAMEA